MSSELISESFVRATIRRVGWFVACALSAVLIMTVVSGCAGQRDNGSAKAVPASKSRPQKNLTDSEQERPKLQMVTRTLTINWDDKSGKPQMQAQAKSFIGDELTGKGTMLEAKVNWYENGKLTTVMEAPRIDVEQTTRTLIASGGVKLHSISRNTVVKAQWLKWYAATHKVVGNGGVEVVSDVGAIKAAGLTADTELKKIEFTSGGTGGSASFNP